MKLKDKVSAVTGGGGVLCSEFAMYLAMEGSRVALLDKNETAVKEAAEKIKSLGGEAIGIYADVLNKESLLTAKETVKSAFGKCDILVNGAGGNHQSGTTENELFSKCDLDKDIKTFFDLDAAGIEFVFNLNFLGTLLPTQIFAADMIDKNEGTIINISSMNAFRPLTKIPVYSGAKAAVSNFTMWLAVHFASANIRVNAIAPGFFSTNQNRALLYNSDGSLTKRANKIINHTPMNRFGVPKDLKGTLLFLADKDASGFVTGVIIPVDGGFSAYSGV